MTAHLTAAEARKLGLDVPATKKRTTRRTAKGPYLTVCHDCGETFTTQAAETRHLDDTRHCRYQLEVTAS